jgi:hypothetical protein
MKNCGCVYKNNNEIFGNVERVPTSQISDITSFLSATSKY